MDAVKPTSLKIEDIHVDLVVPNPDNINEMDEKTFGFLVENIKEVGLIDPVQVIPISDGKYFLMGGEHRWKAAKEIGYTYIPAVVLTEERWSDADYTDLISFRMNSLRGMQKPERFLKVYDRMALKFGTEKLQEVFQIADRVLWKKLTKNLTKGLKDNGVPEEVLSGIESASEKAKSFEAFNKKLNKILSEYSQSGEGQTVVFSGVNASEKSGQKAVVIQVSDDVFGFISELNEYAHANGKSFSEILHAPLESALRAVKP